MDLPEPGRQPFTNKKDTKRGAVKVEKVEKLRRLLVNASTRPPLHLAVTMFSVYPLAANYMTSFHLKRYGFTLSVDHNELC